MPEPGDAVSTAMLRWDMIQRWRWREAKRRYRAKKKRGVVIDLHAARRDRLRACRERQWER